MGEGWGRRCVQSTRGAVHWTRNGCRQVSDGMVGGGNRGCRCTDARLKSHRRRRITAIIIQPRTKESFCCCNTDDFLTFSSPRRVQTTPLTTLHHYPASIVPLRACVRSTYTSSLLNHLTRAPPPRTVVRVHALERFFCYSVRVKCTRTVFNPL